MTALELAQILNSHPYLDKQVKIVDMKAMQEVDIAVFYNKVDNTILIAHEHFLELNLATKLFEELK